MDKYQEKYIKMIEDEFNSGNDQDGLCAIIDKIYEDGYEDGVKSEQEEIEREKIRQGKA